MSALVRSSNAARSAGVHRVGEPTVSVVLRALVREPVSNLVADDRANRTIVGRSIPRLIDDFTKMAAGKTISLNPGL